MPRKIYDIKPPKLAHKAVKEIKESPVEVKTKRHHSRHKKENQSILPTIFIGAGAVLLVVAVILFIKLPKADITIWPKVETLSYKQTISADKSVDAVDLTNSAIPAQYFQATKTNSQDFPATGSASNDGQASGTITVYNKSDPVEPLTFKAGTHFMSDSGKVFVALKKIVVPAATKKGSKVTPGSVQVAVQAVESGTDYNIPPANFSLTGLKGTPYYYSVYGVSTIAMSGGYTGKVKKVTDDDIQGAKDVLTKKTTDDAVAALKSQISSDYVLLDNALLSNIASASTQTKAGAIAEDFNYQVTVNANALAFKKADIENFAKNYIVSQIPSGKTLLDNSFKIDYSASTVDVSDGKATLNLNFSSGVYQNIDKNSMTISLLGENTDQINRTINNSLGDRVSKIKVNFWPFWVTSAPNSQKAVNIQLKFQ